MESLLKTLNETLKDGNERILKVLEEIKEEMKLIKKPGEPTENEDLWEEEEVVPSPTNGDLYESTGYCGSGAYGRVHKVANKRTKETYAMKMIPLEGSTVNKDVAREISLLRDSHHENIVRVKQVFISSNSMNLVMDYIPKNLSEDLKDHPETYRDISVIKKILKQLLSALAYLHKKPVIHRDVKPENILIDENKFLLADFGSARIADVPLTPKVTTLQYRAPEVLLGSVNYTTAIDIWAVGCIFSELLVSSPTFTNGFEQEVIVDIFSKLKRPTEAEWPELPTLPQYQKDMVIFSDRELKAIDCLGLMGKNLLLKLLSVVPSKRITAEDALKHPFLWSEYNE